MFPTPTQNDPLAAILAEYAASQQKGGDPANLGAPPAPSNFTLDINGRPMQFAGPEDASKVVSATVSAYEQQLAAVKAEQEQLLARLNEMQQNQFAAPQQDFGAPKPVIDPEENAKLLLADPAQAYERGITETKAFKELKEELANAKRLSVEQQFIQRHPRYANQQSAKVIGGIIQQAGLQFTPEHLELAVGFAQAQGLRPNEQVLAQQAQAAQAARMAQMFNNPGQPQVGGYENFGQQPGWPAPAPFAPLGPPTMGPGGFAPNPMMQYGQGMNAPPPSPNRGYGGQPSSYDQLVTASGDMSTEQLKRAIEQLTAQGVR